MFKINIFCIFVAMNNTGIIKIEGKQDTPSVLIDEKAMKIKISGSSFNELAIDTYYMILDWIHKVENNLTETLCIEFDYIYVNSASKKMIFVIINHLDKMHKEGKPVSIIWHYEEYDEDMQEMGVDFAEIIGLPFEFVPNSDADNIKDDE